MKIPLYPALRVDGIQKVAGNNCNGNKLNREDQLTLTANSLTSLTLGDEKESSYMDPELESQQTFQTFDEISIVESCSDLLDIDLDAPEFTVQLKNGVQKSLFREGHDVIYFPKSGESGTLFI